MGVLTSIIKRVIFPNSYSSEAYVNYLKRGGVNIGTNCQIWSPNQTHIDVTRGHMLSIGNNVRITRNVTILCHDYSRSVFCNKNGMGNVGEAAITSIGNNVFIGVNATILMGSYIGDDCIIGAGAVVSGTFPSGSVVAGNPARIICSIDELFHKRKSQEFESAKAYAVSWKEKYGRYPTVEQMTNAFSWLYLPHTRETVEKYPHLFQLKGVDKETYIDSFLKTNPLFSSYEEFISVCQKEDENE